jgi:hypothetical protein
MRFQRAERCERCRIVLPRCGVNGGCRHVKIAIAPGFLKNSAPDTMEREGPLLESLIRRLAETPADFLAEPRMGQSGRVETAAVVGDLLRLLNIEPRPEQLNAFVSRRGPLTTADLPEYAERNSPEFSQLRHARNRLAIALVLCWLLADDWFRRAGLDADHLFQLLNDGTVELAPQVPAKRFVTDPDRREELARMALARLGFRPAGETLAQAQDRLTTLNSTERARVLKASRAAEERAQKIREALIKKAAEESADKWTRD